MQNDIFACYSSDKTIYLINKTAITTVCTASINTLLKKFVILHKQVNIFWNMC